MSKKDQVKLIMSNSNRNSQKISKQKCRYFFLLHMTRQLAKSAGCYIDIEFSFFLTFSIFDFETFCETFFFCRVERKKMKGVWKTMNTRKNRGVFSTNLDFQQVMNVNPDFFKGLLL